MTILDEGLQVEGFRLDDVTVIVVRGDFDATATRALRTLVDSLGPNDHIYVDCIDVTWIDGSGLGLLHELAARNVAAGCPLHIYASAEVRRHIEVSGLERLFALD